MVEWRYIDKGRCLIKKSNDKYLAHLVEIVHIHSGHISEIELPEEQKDMFNMNALVEQRKEEMLRQIYESK